jgi:hypothetical protein
MMAERPDWALFRTLDGLQQRAGVPARDLHALVLKELADNEENRRRPAGCNTTLAPRWIRPDIGWRVSVAQGLSQASTRHYPDISLYAEVRAIAQPTLCVSQRGQYLLARSVENGR